MATTTVPTSAAPTEEEIRQAIEDEYEKGLVGRSLDTDDLLGMHLVFVAIMDSDMARSREPSGWDSDFSPGNRYRDEDKHHPGTLWADLTQAEAEELHGAVAAVQRRVADEAERAFIDGVVAAAVAFAERHPDVPRGRWQPKVSA